MFVKLQKLKVHYCIIIKAVNNKEVFRRPWLLSSEFGVLSMCCLQISNGQGSCGISHNIRAKRKHDEAYLERWWSLPLSIFALFYRQLKREYLSSYWIIDWKRKGINIMAEDMGSYQAKQWDIKYEKKEQKLDFFFFRITEEKNYLCLRGWTTVVGSRIKVKPILRKSQLSFSQVHPASHGIRLD